MSKLTRVIGGALCVLLVMSLCIGLGAWLTIRGGHKTTSDITQRPLSTDTKGTNKLPTSREIALAIENDFRLMGFKPNEWNTTPNWGKNPADVNRQFSFSGQTLKSQQDVANFLNGSSEGSRLARQQVLSTLHGVDRQRALSGQGYVPIQFKISVQYEGNTYKDGDKIITPSGPRQAEPGDVIWAFIRNDGTIDLAASVRADCGNGSFVRIIPVRPQTSPAPPVTCLRNCGTPPVHHGGHKCAPSTPYGHPPYCKDGGSAEKREPAGGNYNTDKGPGARSKEHLPPSHPYTPPSSPQPSKTPRPTPAPSPAPGASDPSDPPTTCAPPPGMTHC